jgi:hypothetical protein
MKKYIAVLLMVPTMAMAEFYSGNILLSKMRSGNAVDKSLALGYVLGVYDSFLNINHCPPPNVTAGQIHDMVQQALVEIPSIRNNTADVIVQGVLAAEWPCASRGGRGA